MIQQTFALQAGETLVSSDKSWLCGLHVQVGCNKVMIDCSPLVPAKGNRLHAIKTHDPIGRSYYVQTKYKLHDLVS